MSQEIASQATRGVIASTPKRIPKVKKSMMMSKLKPPLGGRA